MNYSVFRISLDVHKTASQLSFSIKKGDTTRRLQISLTENGAPYRITDECYATFSVRKPDGTKVFNDCTIQDNMIIYDMTPQSTAAVGRCEAEVVVYGYDGQQITSPSFSYFVYNPVTSDAELVSTDEVTALGTLITEANSAINRANSVAATVETKLANGEFIGEQGETGNGMVFRFSAHKDGTDFSATWKPGMFYMGVASVPSGDPAPTDKSAYTWTMFATNIFEILPVTLSASAWSGGEQVVAASLINESALIPSPADDDSLDAWVSNGLRLDSALEDSMTFTCKKTPTVDIEVNVLVLQPLAYVLPRVTKADAGKYLRVNDEGKVEAVADDIFVVKLNPTGTALANTTFVDIGNALYNGKTLELRYYDALTSYRSCSYIYNSYNTAAGIYENELLFFVPYTEHGNGYTFPGRKIVKITGSGVTVITTHFNESM